MPRAAQAAEPFLADGEDDDDVLGREPLDDVDDDRDGERVVADPGAGQNAVALLDAVLDLGREDSVDVRQEPERVRRLAEPPDEVSDRVALARPGGVREPRLEPRDARLLTEVRGRDLRQRRRIPLDIRTNVRDDRASLLV